MSIALLLAHAFYSADCCGGNDCAPVPCAEVTYDGEGWSYHGKHFSKLRAHIADDGGCHVCIHNGFPICIYLGCVS